MFMAKWALKLGFLFIAGMLSGVTVRAQIIPEPLSLAASPSSPSPGETYTVTAITPTLDKDAAFFEWAVDGRLRSDLSGPGKNSITLVAGPLGSATTVNVRLLHLGQLLRSSLVVRPANLSLVWYAKTYTPRWYKGKALPIQSSIVNIVALPEMIRGGVRLSSDNLIYRWSLDDQKNIVVGVGKNVFSIQTSDLAGSQHRVRIVIETPAQDFQKEGEIFIIPETPRISLYVYSPLGKIEPRRAIYSLVREKGELLDLEVEPFFFNASSKKDLTYRWTVAGREVTGAAQNPYILTLDTSTEAVGEIPVSVAVDDSNPLIGGVSKALSLFLR